MPDMLKLTVKQQKFVDCYNGDIKEAAKKAGLSYNYCRRMVTKSHILEAIKKRQDTEVRPKLIAKRQQRQEFWTTVMNDTAQAMRDRLKASELLGKSEADFTENMNHTDSDYDDFWAYLTPAERMKVMLRKEKGESYFKPWEKRTVAERLQAMKESDG